jgi:hypothetical protein
LPMSNYKHPEKKASETVTFRLTLWERRLLGHLAELEKKSLTDLVRFLLLRHADQLGVDELPEPKPKRRPGRPRKLRPMSVPPPVPIMLEAEELLSQPPVPIILEAEELLPLPIEVEDELGVMVFGDLVELFRVHFARRAEGTKKELESTIDFLTVGAGGQGPLLPRVLPLTQLTSAKLEAVRAEMAAKDIRLAKKNLHMTYLRMMMHFAVKEEAIALQVNPALDLKPFTLGEVPGNSPLFSGPDH